MGVVYKHEKLPCEGYKIFEEMRRKKEFCDVTLRVGDHSIQAHQVILSASIPYFRTSFGFSAAESQQSVISLTDVNPVALEAVIDFAYRCEVEITTENAEMLLSAACFLQVDYVRKVCVEFLISRISAKDALNLREFGNKIGCLDLVEKIDCYVKQNFGEIFHSDGFCRLPVSYVKNLLIKDDLHVASEEKVFEAVMRWVKESPDDRCCELPDLLSCMRMPFLNLNYLRDHIATEELVRGSLPCRDILDDARDYHLFPEKRRDIATIWKFSLKPRKYEKRAFGIKSIMTEKSTPSANITQEQQDKSLPFNVIAEFQQNKEQPQNPRDIADFWTSQDERIKTEVNAKLRDVFFRTQLGEAATPNTQAPNIQVDKSYSKYPGCASPNRRCRKAEKQPASSNELEAYEDSARRFLDRYAAHRMSIVNSLYGGSREEMSDSNVGPLLSCPERIAVRNRITNEIREIKIKSSRFPSKSVCGEEADVFSYTESNDRMKSSQDNAQLRQELYKTKDGWKPMHQKNYDVPLLYVKYHPSIDSSVNVNLLKKVYLQ